MWKDGSLVRGSPSRIALVVLVVAVVALSLPRGSGTPVTNSAAAAPALASGAGEAALGPASSALHESTLVLFNDTDVPGDFYSQSSDLPSLEAYDNESDRVFVEGFYSGVIDVVSGHTNEVVATISTGEYPNTLAYDQKDNALFYGLQAYDEVGFVNASSDLIERVVSIGFEPLAMAADPNNGDLYVTGWNATGTAFVAVLSGTNGTVRSTLSFGADRFPIAGPNGLAFDSVNGDFYVPSIPSGVGGSYGNLTVLSGARLAVVRTIVLPFEPNGILYVPSLKEFYLGNSSAADLTVFNPSSRTATGTVTLPDIATMMTYASNHNRVFVGIEGNVSVVSPSSGKILATFPVTREPDGLAFNNRNGDLYISDYVGNNVSVVNGQSYRVLGSILLGAAPYNMAYDAANGNLYVADLLSSQLIVLNATSNRVTGYVPLGTTPYGIVYDPQTKELYVDDYYAGNVSVVNPTTASVVGYLPAGVEPWGIAYDASNHDVWVTNPASNNVTILDPSAGTVVRSLSFSTPPGAIAYDAKGHTMFVGEYNTGNVSVFNATTDRLIRNATSGGEPYTIAIDTATGDAYVGNYLSDNVTILGDRGQETGFNVTAGVGVFGSAYDPVDKDVYVASFDSDLVTTISGTSESGVGGFSVGSGPVAVAVDPVTGTVYVANYDSGSLTLLTPSAVGRPATPAASDANPSETLPVAPPTMATRPTAPGSA